MLLATFLCLCVFLLYRYLWKPLDYFKERGIKHSKPKLLFGNSFDNIMQRRSFNDSMTEWYNRFEGERYFGVYTLSFPNLVIRDPDLIKEIAVKEFDKFHDHSIISREDIDPLWSKNLFSSKGEKWRKLRPILSPSFTGSKMKIMFGLIDECAQKLVSYFSEKSGDGILTVEMKDTFTRYANDVIATCAFGVSCDSLREKENEFFLKGIDASDFSGLKQIKFILSPHILKLFNIKIFSDDVGNFFRRLVKEAIHTREEQGTYRPDMLQLLMEAQKKHQAEGKEEITYEDITAQALIFFLAGFDTTSTLIVFAAYELAANKEIQDRLLEEVEETYASTKGKLSYEALNKMKYLDMCISETLRKWTPTQASDRICTEDFVIEPKNPGEKAVHIKKGNIVWFPVFQLHHDKKYFPEPERFDPERFSDENKADIHPATYIPFGLGPRLCIGSRFALMETKALLFYMLREFEIVPITQTKIPPVLSKKHFTTHSEGGMWLGLKKRLRT